MPKVSLVFIRWSLIQLGIASTIGLLLLISKATGEWMHIWMIRPLHTEGMWFGWIINLVLGTAWWIMPKRHDFPDKYGNQFLGWLSFALIQGDWLFRIVINAHQAPMLVRFLPLFGMICFVFGIWPRLKHMIHEH
jgi:cbb3-type cytochrome oxidase subunit 1